MKRGWWIALAGADGAVLAAFWPDVAGLRADLGAPHAWVERVGTDRALASLAAGGLWLVALWLSVGLAAAVLTGLPGRAGRCAAALTRLALPAVLRRAIAGTAGLGVLLAPVAGGLAPAGAAPPSPGVCAAVTTHVTGQDGGGRIEARARTPNLPTPTWPTDPRSAAPHLPAPTWPTTPTAQPATPASRGGAVVVHGGDSLWLLAARRLGPDATQRQIALEWPRWYAANRAAIGPDPDRLVPGEVLHAPDDRQEGP